MKSPVANDNQGPIVELRPTGSGTELYRTLARVLVRLELRLASPIPPEIDCDDQRAAG